MNQQFSDEEDHLSDGNPICQLLVYTEEDGNIYFSCDWSEIDEASTSLGAMLYRLSDGELVNEILNNLKSQCVLEDREGDYDKISTVYSNLKELKKTVEEISEDSVVVDPLDATTF
jgi:hypothetical protein